ncbi:uncharacterized protein LOC143673315 isoform X9 [Tamandua tetradactyla]|uniref:uncharacterized protein LOC143673315 isoform X9 n=1 Tax=Tamandua tetradactyla TaxID=48850 RepID=UPI0040549F1B
MSSVNQTELQEGTSKFATLEMNPKRAQKRQQQQERGRMVNFSKRRKPPPVSGAPASILVGWEEFPGLTPADVIKARMTRVSSTGGTSTGCLNLREASGLSWVLGIRQLCARIPPPLLTSPVIAVWVNLPIVTELVSVTSASRGTSSPSSSMKPGATLTTHTAHGSLPSSSQQVGDRCVSLDMVDGNMHKSILVNWAVLQIPDMAHGFYAMDTSANLQFLLTKRTFAWRPRSRTQLPQCFCEESRRDPHCQRGNLTGLGACQPQGHPSRVWLAG